MKQVDPFYLTKAWRKLRLQAIGIKFSAGCARCGQPFASIKNVHVDHIIDWKDDPHLALDMGNLQLMHHHCHSKKTREKENTNVEVGVDGLPEGWA